MKRFIFKWINILLRPTGYGVFSHKYIINFVAELVKAKIKLRDEMAKTNKLVEQNNLSKLEEKRND